MMDAELLQILVCPQNRMRLGVADAALVARLNRAIAAGEVRNGAGQPIGCPIQGGLVRRDGAVLYPILDGLPILLADEAIALAQIRGAGC